MDKVIYTDCDGVLLDWESAFHKWMEEKGYTVSDPALYKMHVAYDIAKEESKRLIREFNESSWMVNLQSLRDARSGVARLVEAGYQLHVITSMTTDRNAQALRIQNLNAVFGTDAFVDFTFLDTGADKDEVLAQLPKGAWWIEDKDENAIAGDNVGLVSLLVAHAHNAHIENIPRFDRFNDLVDRILLA